MPQQERKGIQAGGTKERGASLAAVGSSGVAQQPTGEQGNDEQEQQDFIRHGELLRTFDVAMQRWYANICTPEYLVYHNPKAPLVSAQSVWGYGIGYPLTTPPRIAPQKGIGYGSSRPEGDEVGVEMTEGGDAYFHRLTFQAWRPMRNAFRDPYTGEKLADIKVHLRTKEGSGRRHFYVVSITEGIYSHPEPRRELLQWSGFKQRSLEYEVTGLDTGKPRLHIQKAWDAGKGAELLSEPHAIKLFNLMDSLTPPGPAGGAAQTEQHASLEPLPVLPHPGRRPTG